MSNIDSPLISVAFPSYNHERYIDQTLRSIYEQTYERIELIVIDDRSTDRTFEVAEDIANSLDYRNRFERVTVTRNDKNLGAYASLNRCLTLARGEFTSFLNSDDLYVSNRVEILSDACLRKKSAFAFSGTLAIDELGQPDMTDVALSVGANPERVLVNAPSLSFGFLRYQLSASTGNMFVNTNIARDIGGFKDLKYCHDWDFALRLICLTEPVFDPRPMYLYRIHASNSFKSLGHLAHQESEEVLTRYFQNVLLGNVANLLAPSPFNWPGVFEVYLQLFEIDILWKGVSGDAFEHWRTVEGAAAAVRNPNRD